MRAKNISLRLSSRVILNNVSCAVSPGRVTVIMGKNGAGKSTLLQLMAGHGTLGAGAGAMYLDQEAMEAIPPQELARRRAVLAQSAHLSFPLPVREVVELGCYNRYHSLTANDRRRLVTHYLNLLGMEAFRDRAFPSLSGGEQKRVLLAKCLLQLDVDNSNIQHNRYLLLDEPTAALDLEQQYKFLDLATQLARDRNLGVLAVLHDLNLAARFADEIVLLRDGSITASGPLSSVLNQTNIRTTFDVDCLIQDHPIMGGPLITPLPHGNTTKLTPAQAS